MKEYAEEIGFILRDYDCSPINWWEHAAFRKNQTLIQNLIDVFLSCDAGLFLFSEDDLLSIQNGEEIKIPRDNVIFEYGLFTGIHGKEKSVILRLGEPRLPVDLSGVLYIQLKYNNSERPSVFKQNNTEDIKRWIQDIRREADLRLNERIIQSLKSISSKLHPDLNFKIEEIILSLQGKASDIDYNEKNVMRAIQGYLQNGIAKSIFGIDVVGPKGWLSPSIYHYLAPQLREYLRRNVNGFGQFHLKIDARIAGAVANAITNAKAFLKESYTEFDNISESFILEKVAPQELSLQYCRILLWSKAELMRPETLAVIRFHEAFRIPLFYLETSFVDKNRDDDFLIIEDEHGRCLCCCNSSRQSDYRNAEAVENQKIMIELSRKVTTFLNHEKILFAEDARLIYGQPTN